METAPYDEEYPPYEYDNTNDTQSQTSATIAILLIILFVFICSYLFIPHDGYQSNSGQNDNTDKNEESTIQWPEQQRRENEVSW